MGFNEEMSRLAWKARSYRDFFCPQKAIFGWFSTHNLGDVAALESLRKFLPGSWKVISPQTYRRIPDNLKIFVCGAGGCINAATAGHVLKYLRRMKRHGFPRLLLSAGVNRDFSDDAYYENKDLFREFLSQFDFLSVRDRLSQRFLQQLGFRNVSLIPDLVLSTPGVAGRTDVRNFSLKRVGLLLASNNLTFFSSRKEITRLLVKICDDVLGRGYEMVCIPYQVDVSSPRHKRHSEIPFACAIKEQVRTPERFVIASAVQTPAEIVSFIARELYFVVSMRLHGNVFAARAGVPFLSLSYNEKNLGFLEMMSMPEFSLPLVEGGPGLEHFQLLREKIETQYEPISRQIWERTAELQKQTREGMDRVKAQYPSLDGSR